MASGKWESSNSRRFTGREVNFVQASASSLHTNWHNTQAYHTTHDKLMTISTNPVAESLYPAHPADRRAFRRGSNARHISRPLKLQARRLHTWLYWHLWQSQSCTGWAMWQLPGDCLFKQHSVVVRVRRCVLRNIHTGIIDRKSVV